MKSAAAIPVDGSARTLTDGSPVTDDHRELLPRHVSHFSTCPNAGQHRRAR